MRGDSGSKPDSSNARNWEREDMRHQELLGVEKDRLRAESYQRVESDKNKREEDARTVSWIANLERHLHSSR